MSNGRKLKTKRQIAAALRDLAGMTADALDAYEELISDQHVEHEALIDVLFGRDGHEHGTPAACGMCQRIAYAEAVERLMAERKGGAEGDCDVSQD